MNIRPILYILMFASLFIDSTLISFPLLFILCLLNYILYSDIKSLTTGVFALILLDILRVSQIGLMPAFFLVTCLVLNLYKKNFEIKDFKMVIFFLFIAGLSFAAVFNYSPNILIYVLVYGVASLVFVYFYKKQNLW